MKYNKTIMRFVEKRYDCKFYNVIIKIGWMIGW